MPGYFEQPESCYFGKLITSNKVKISDFEISSETGSTSQCISTRLKNFISHHLKALKMIHQNSLEFSEDYVGQSPSSDKCIY